MEYNILLQIIIPYIQMHKKSTDTSHIEIMIKFMGRNKKILTKVRFNGGGTRT